jgi:putative protease
VVLARECTLEEIKNISSKTSTEIEVFIHGAMCMSVSGKCTLSNHMTNRDANRGGCAQSCRWFYNLYDEGKNSVSDTLFTLSSKDLRIISHIEKLIEYGVSSLKIEGRMKSEYYIATIISQYRKIIDDIYQNKLKKEKKYIKQLDKAASRPASIGFYNGTPTPNEQIYDKTAEIPLQNFVARVLDYDKSTKKATIEQRNNFTIKKKIEIFGPNGKLIKFKIKNLYDKDGNKVIVASHAKEILYFYINAELSEFDMIRQKK